jgi:hypothetical protein
VLGSPLGCFGVLCWAMPEAMIDRLVAEAQVQLGAGNGGLPEAKRRLLTRPKNSCFERSFKWTQIGSTYQNVPILAQFASLDHS